MPAVVASTTVRFQVNGLKKDGVVYDLTGATVTLLLRDPAGTLHTKSATIVSGPLGSVRYDTTTSDITTPGQWKRAWRVVHNGLDLISLPVSFVVVTSP